MSTPQTQTQTQTPFKQIKKYCIDKGLSKMHERFLYHKYVEDLDDLIERYRASQGKEPSKDIKEGYVSTLTSHSTLSTNVILADDEIKKITKKEAEKAKMKVSIFTFSMDVVSGVVASIVFSVLLIVVFTLAQSQIKSWVEDLYNNNTQIENKVNPKEEAKQLNN